MQKVPVKYKYFDDKEVIAMTNRFNRLHIRHRQNKFFIDIINKIKKDKKLTIKQFQHFQFTYTYGKTMYEAKLIPNNY